MTEEQDQKTEAAEAVDEVDDGMEVLPLKPIYNVSGTLDLPGSKSLSNRILLLSALAEGQTTIENLQKAVSHEEGA